MNKTQKDLYVGILGVILVVKTNNALSAVVPAINSDQDKTIEWGGIKMRKFW